MTTTDFLIDAVFITLAQAVTIFCLMAMAAIVTAAWVSDRGINAVWPDEHDDVTRSTETEKPS